jgi:predicted sulfurtransferase
LNTKTILNIAAYRFVAVDQLPERREALSVLCQNLSLKGSILLSTEGINLFLAGTEDNITAFITYLNEDLLFQPLGMANVTYKKSWSATQPFNRMLVKLKQEIIPLGLPEIQPSQHTAPALPPQLLKQWLDEGIDFTLLDTRNDYEIRLGTFEKATVLDLQHFRDFPSACEAQLPEEAKHKPMVMFCTGGIRCEKASVALEQQGYTQVYQLEGGILNYFEHCGGAHYKGDCFVFDKRVALDPNLEETQAALCYRCLNPLTEAEQQSPDYIVDVSCPYCVDRQKKSASID